MKPSHPGGSSAAAVLEEPSKGWKHDAKAIALQPTFADYARLQFTPEDYVAVEDVAAEVEAAPVAQAETGGAPEGPAQAGGEQPPPSPTETHRRLPEQASAPDGSAQGPTEMAVSFSMAAGMPASLRIALAGIAVAIFGVVGYFGFQSNAGKPSPGAERPDAGILVTPGDWISNWSSHPEGKISIFGPSVKWSDYRVVFKGEIERRSLTWIFRASDPLNFYVMKLEVSQTDTSRKASLVRYVVADGRMGWRTETPLALPVHADTVYRVELEVRRATFTVAVQGEQVLSWTDDRHAKGGFGFINSDEERSKVHSFRIFLLKETAGAAKE